VLSGHPLTVLSFRSGTYAGLLRGFSGRLHPIVSNVDLHNHVIPPTILEAVRRDPHRFGLRLEESGGRMYLERGGHARLEVLPAFYDIEAKIESMDRMQLDIAALSMAPPGFFYSLGAEAGLAAARLENDGIAQMVAKHPSRLRGMATLPMQDPDAAIVELERVVKEYGFRAVEVGTSIEGRQLSDPSLRSVLKSIEQLGCLLFAHPYTCVAKGGMEAYNLMILMGYPIDTTIMLAHLMLSGALEDLRDLRILTAHGGGVMPYLVGRFTHLHRSRADLRAKAPTSPADLLRRLYFDALLNDPIAIRHLVNEVGADHVVIGTDHPYDVGPALPVAEIEKVPGLSEAERRAICGETALRLLGE